MKCIICSQEFEGRSDAKTCSSSCRTTYGRIKNKQVVAPKIELSVTNKCNNVTDKCDIVTDKLNVTDKNVTDNLDEYSVKNYPNIEITPEVEKKLVEIYLQYEKENKGFKCIPCFVRGVRILTIWEKMKLQEYNQKV